MELEKILEEHKKWLSGNDEGVQADLRGADLHSADLYNANLRGVLVSVNSLGFFSACPKEGSFVAYKKASGKIVVLEIPSDAKRSSPTSLKCRCDKAKVLRIENLDGTIASDKSVASDYDAKFVYTVGETVSVDDFETDRWRECAAGIHFFIDRDCAKVYD